MARHATACRKIGLSPEAGPEAALPGGATICRGLRRFAACAKPHPMAWRCGHRGDGDRRSRSGGGRDARGSGPPFVSPDLLRTRQRTSAPDPTWVRGAFFARGSPAGAAPRTLPSVLHPADHASMRRMAPLRSRFRHVPARMRPHARKAGNLVFTRTFRTFGRKLRAAARLRPPLDRPPRRPDPFRS